MKRPRSPIFTILLLVVLPAAAALGVTLLVLNLIDGPQEPQTVMLPTFSGTALIPPRDGSEIIPASGESGAGGAVAAAQETAPPGEAGPCENVTHAVLGGETLGGIAEQYGMTLEDVVLINQMQDPAFDPDFLSIGQQIVIPTCGVPTPTPTATPTATPIPTRVIPTPNPTATERAGGRLAVEVARVLNPGDVTSEAVEVVNRGTSGARLGGWKLVNERTGGAFVFPPLNLFPQGAVTVYSGVGENTAIDIYWGRDQAVWQPGDGLQLLDGEDVVRDEYEIPEG